MGNNRPGRNYHPLEVGDRCLTLDGHHGIILDIDHYGTATLKTETGRIIRRYAKQLAYEPDSETIERRAADVQQNWDIAERERRRAIPTAHAELTRWTEGTRRKSGERLDVE